MKVHLVDGTYELFRQHFGSAGRRSGNGDAAQPLAATIGVVSSTLGLLADGAFVPSVCALGLRNQHASKSEPTPDPPSR